MAGENNITKYSFNIFSNFLQLRLLFWKSFGPLRAPHIVARANLPVIFHYKYSQAQKLDAEMKFLANRPENFTK